MPEMNFLVKSEEPNYFLLQLLCSVSERKPQVGQTKLTTEEYGRRSDNHMQEKAVEQTPACHAHHDIVCGDRGINNGIESVIEF